MSNAKTSTQPLVIAYQGTDGAYSQIAAENYFTGRTLQTRGYDTFRQMLESVESGVSDFGMQPIENTTAGSINEAYDLLAHMNLYVVGEEVLRVEHCLLALGDVGLDAIRRVYSHPQALAQCSDFLASLQQCTVQAFTDTAMSVKKVRDEADSAQAAVASERAAKLYGLSVLKRDIANQKNNFTRFVVVSKTPSHYAVDIPCKTSVIFTTRHEQGALVRCLNILSNQGLNLTKIESRPRPNTPWEYIFYVDIEGNIASPNVEHALGEMQQHTSFFKLLGSYPIRTRKSETLLAQMIP